MQTAVADSVVALKMLSLQIRSYNKSGAHVVYGNTTHSVVFPGTHSQYAQHTNMQKHHMRMCQREQQTDAASKALLLVTSWKRGIRRISLVRLCLRPLAAEFAAVQCVRPAGGS
jgi:hypothetical protein